MQLHMKFIIHLAAEFTQTQNQSSGSSSIGLYITGITISRVWKHVIILCNWNYCKQCNPNWKGL